MKDPSTDTRDAEAAAAAFQLTYVVVGKRHNTRFYPVSRDQTFGKSGAVNGNVKPGLLVDQAITHPYSFDFYLQSHQPLAGTGRSAHYFVLMNQMGLTASNLPSIASPSPPTLGQNDSY